MFGLAPLSILKCEIATTASPGAEAMAHEEKSALVAGV